MSPPNPCKFFSLSCPPCWGGYPSYFHLQVLALICGSYLQQFEWLFIFSFLPTFMNWNSSEKKELSLLFHLLIYSSRYRSMYIKLLYSVGHNTMLSLFSCSHCFIFWPLWALLGWLPCPFHTPHPHPFLSTCLLLWIKRCFRLIQYFSCLSLGIHHFFKETLWLLSLENGL